MPSMVELPVLPPPVDELWHTLLGDPFDLGEQMTRKDRQRLRLARGLLDDVHPAWLLVPGAIRGAGQVAYGVLHG